MGDIRSMADELREKINGGAGQPQEAAGSARSGAPAKKKAVPSAAGVMELLRDYDTKDHRSMVHARFDAKTLQRLNHFKLATGIDNSKLVAFSVKYLFEKEPELLAVIKHFIQNLEL